MWLMKLSQLANNLDTTPSFWSCIVFAIVEQLIKLKFLAQQVELKWMILNKWRRLFHSSGVKFPFVNMSASWCEVSMWRVWILGSKLSLSNDQSRATLWVRETCLSVGLQPLIIISITGSLSSQTNNIQHSTRNQNSWYLMECYQCLLEWRWCAWLGWNYACLAWQLPTGFPVALSWVLLFGTE